jgi:hypothetical protein
MTFLRKILRNLCESELSSVSLVELRLTKEGQYGEAVASLFLIFDWRDNNQVIAGHPHCGNCWEKNN